ncbi:MAG: hypothetical protein ABIR37_03095 [Candidatus Saccharimonadales bacterium]
MSKNRALRWHPYFYKHPDFKPTPYDPEIEISFEAFHWLGETVLLAGPRLAGKTEIGKHLGKICAANGQALIDMPLHELTSADIQGAKVFGIASENGAWIRRFQTAYPIGAMGRETAISQDTAALSILYHDPAVEWVENPLNSPDLAAEVIYERFIHPTLLTTPDKAHASAANMMVALRSLG